MGGLAMVNGQAEPQSGLDRLSHKLDGHIRSFRRSAAWYRYVYFATAMSTLILSALITVISGWNSSSSKFDQGHIVLVLGALSTVVSGGGFFFSPKNSWLIFAASINRLRALRSKIEFVKMLPEHIDSDKELAEFYSEYQAIMDMQNTAWLDLRESTAAPSAKVQAAATAPHGGVTAQKE